MSYVKLFFLSFFLWFHSVRTYRCISFFLLHRASFPTHCGESWCGHTNPILFVQCCSLTDCPNPVNCSPSDSVNTACHWSTVGRRMPKSPLLWSCIFFYARHNFLGQATDFTRSDKTTAKKKPHPSFWNE